MKKSYWVWILCFVAIGLFLPTMTQAIDPLTPMYGTVPCAEGQCFSFPVSTRKVQACPDTRCCQDAVGRYQMNGEYRLDTVTGEVRRLAELAETCPAACPAPNTDPVTLKLIVGPQEELLHEVSLDRVYVNESSIGVIVVDVTEAIRIWFEKRLADLFGYVVPV